MKLNKQIKLLRCLRRNRLHEGEGEVSVGRLTERKTRLSNGSWQRFVATLSGSDGGTSRERGRQRSVPMQRTGYCLPREKRGDAMAARQCFMATALDSVEDAGTREREREGEIES